MSAVATVEMSNGSDADLRSVEAFLYREAWLLDECRFEEWQELFTTDGDYWVPARPDQPDPLSEISIFYDDRDLMHTRIERLRHPEIHIQNPPSRMIRFVSNVWLERGHQRDADLLVRSNLFIHEYRQNRQRIFSGRASHALVRDGSDFRIRRKKVELINADGSFGPLAIPF